MSREDALQKLSAGSPIIAPSMLKCDFSRLHEEVAALDAAGSQILHWDVMDGHFVDNLSYGAMVFAPLRNQTSQLFDAHLMISDPQKYLDDYLRAGCDCITVHVEAVPDLAGVLTRIRNADCVAGLSLNPGTSLETIEPFLPLCDVVLLMSVEPGFGGQAFQPDAVDRLRQLRQMAADEVIISVDGGIGPDTIGDCAAAGASVFVSGSSVFDTGDYSAAIREMRSIAEHRRPSLSSQE